MLQMKGIGCSAEKDVERERAGARVLGKLESAAIRASNAACMVSDRLTGIVRSEDLRCEASVPVPSYPYPLYFGQLDDLINRIDEALTRIEDTIGRVELP